MRGAAARRRFLEAENARTEQRQLEGNAPATPRESNGRLRRPDQGGSKLPHSTSAEDARTVVVGA